MRRRLALLALILLATPWPAVSALPPEDMVIYTEVAGRLHAGLPAGRVDGVNSASHDFAPDDCHRSLRVRLEYEPSNASADTALLFFAARYDVRGRLLDAETGREVAAYTWRSPGTIRWDVEDDRPLRIELTLPRGAAVDYQMRVAGWVHPEAECALRNQILITEVEANPAGWDRDAEWIEIANLGFQDIDLQGWRIETTHGVVREFTFAEPTPLAVGARIQVVFDGQFLDNEDESVLLHAPRGWLIDATPVASDKENDRRSWQLAEDWSGEWVFREATPGATNQ